MEVGLGAGAAQVSLKVTSSTVFLVWVTVLGLLALDSELFRGEDSPATVLWARTTKLFCPFLVNGNGGVDSVIYEWARFFFR